MATMKECRIVTLISNFIRSKINSRFWVTIKIQHTTIIALRARFLLHLDLPLGDSVEGMRPKYMHSLSSKICSSSEAM